MLIFYTLKYKIAFSVEIRIDKMNKQLTQQINFMREIDKLKSVARFSYLLTKERRENSAEHSWHAALMAIILAEYSNEQVAPLRVLKMLLVHDIVEIDAGDTFVYDNSALGLQHKKENLAAERIFGILPENQSQEYLELWIEFEAQKSCDAKFAKAIDRVMPILNNYFTEGLSWQENNIRLHQVLKHKEIIISGSKKLWEYIESILNDAAKKGYLKK